MADYYIYDNGRKGYAKIHKASCHFAKRGARWHGVDAVGPGDQWIPAKDLQDAHARWQALHRGTRGGLRTCKVCKP
jgi:hypothetical protein